MFSKTPASLLFALQEPVMWQDPDTGWAAALWLRCVTQQRRDRYGDGYDGFGFIRSKGKFKQPFKSGLKAKDGAYLTLSYWPCHGRRHITKGGQRTANNEMGTLAL